MGNLEAPSSTVGKTLSIHSLSLYVGSVHVVEYFLLIFFHFNVVEDEGSEKGKGEKEDGKEDVWYDC